MSNQQFPLALSYKGFSATVERDYDDSLLTGHVTGLVRKMTFSGRDLQEIERAFHRSVDEFLEMILADYAQSTEIGDEQQDADKAGINVHLPDEIVHKIHTYRQGGTVEEFIIGLVADEIRNRQQSEDTWRVFDAWNNSLRIIEVIPLETFSLRVKFMDGVEGEYDMKSTIQKAEEFSALANFDYFHKAAIGENGNSIFWSDEIRIGATVIYETIMADLDKAPYG